MILSCIITAYISDHSLARAVHGSINHQTEQEWEFV